MTIQLQLQRWHLALRNSAHCESSKFTPTSPLDPWTSDSNGGNTDIDPASCSQSAEHQPHLVGDIPAPAQPKVPKAFERSKLSLDTVEHVCIKLIHTCIYIYIYHVIITNIYIYIYTIYIYIYIIYVYIYIYTYEYVYIDVHTHETCMYIHISII